MAWIDLQNSNRITAINPILLTIRNKAVESRLPLYLTNSLPPEGQAASHLSFIFFDRSSVDRARRKGFVVFSKAFKAVPTITPVS